MRTPSPLISGGIFNSAVFGSNSSLLVGGGGLVCASVDKADSFPFPSLITFAFRSSEVRRLEPVW